MNDRPANTFRTTRWTGVLAARGESPEARQALRELCEAYYGPVEAFVRRYRGGRDDAGDLTQAFFARLLEGDGLGGVERTRGRFRSYLLGAVKHFLADQAGRSSAEKRGGGQAPQSLDGRPGREPHDVADPHGFPPDAFFDRQWALAVVARAMGVLEAEAQGGRGAAVRGPQAVAPRRRGPGECGRGGPLAGHDRRGVQGRRPPAAEAIPRPRQGPDRHHPG